MFSAVKDPELLKNLLENDYPILFDGLHTCYYINHPQLQGRMKIYRESNIEHDYYRHLAKAETNLIKKYFFLVEAWRFERYQEILKQYWGYDSFRDLQEEIITSIGEGKDTLGLMPTGGGKSITFQVPALAQEGICIVITPLIALMKDQVQNLRKRGIKALAVYSGMTRQEILTALENCIFGDYKFLYISPERLDTDIFRTKTAVDESLYDYG